MFPPHSGHEAVLFSLSHRVTKKRDLAKLASCQALHERAKKARLMRKKDIRAIKEEYGHKNFR